MVGLLAGGILSGESLIKAAYLRAITSEENRWVIAAQSFRDKYSALPGDMNNAQSFWGASATGCNSDAPIDPTKTCNGNGDGKVTWCTGPTPYSCKEVFWFWQQLGFSGLIEGSFTGSGSGVVNPTDAERTNVPGSKYGNWLWNINNANIVGGNNYWITMDYGNYLYLGTANPASATNANVLKAEDAWNIDAKMDDGKPMTGNIVSTENYNGNRVIYEGRCSTAANSKDYTATYVLTNPAISCAIFFTNQF